MPKNRDLKSAVALTYAQTDAAPRVVAKGRGVIAEQIISRAREHGVYVHQSPELVSLLMQIDLDQRIPPQLYVAVAELLAWLYRLESGQNAGAPPAFVPPPESAAGLEK
ncbi:EscU/YscU/HrcU family type III secretion system export apparatus switch protein [Propionivibrio limicola]|uniref:EscU/YscU/HrcU family type III secretion system export apparatus switch protein n=1 Tax=Propionivibrio limicola TaxID=167645 RepID=UPI001292AC39|nr:EscU/YscU/HrcU family type III secretion system export apparatus switch protein [Propionivibrio limicola]